MRFKIAFLVAEIIKIAPKIGTSAATPGYCVVFVKLNIPYIRSVIPTADVTLCNSLEVTILFVA